MLEDKSLHSFMPQIACHKGKHLISKSRSLQTLLSCELILYISFSLDRSLFFLSQLTATAPRPPQHSPSSAWAGDWLAAGRHTQTLKTKARIFQGMSALLDDNTLQYFQLHTKRDFLWYLQPEFCYPAALQYRVLSLILTGHKIFTDFGSLRTCQANPVWNFHLPASLFCLV